MLGYRQSLLLSNLRDGKYGDTKDSDWARDAQNTQGLPAEDGEAAAGHTRGQNHLRGKNETISV
jgi:hypothetical protein